MPLQNTGTNGRGKPFNKTAASREKVFRSVEQTRSSEYINSFVRHTPPRKVHQEVRGEYER